MIVLVTGFHVGKGFMAFTHDVISVLKKDMIAVQVGLCIGCHDA
jgi:hypothetical protein